MPELPEIEVLARRLKEQLIGKAVRSVKVYDHVVIHGRPVDSFESASVGESFQSFRPDGKFIIMRLEMHDLVVNPMLTGRFRVTEGPRSPIKSDMFSVRTDDSTLWYYDRKRMGRVYLVPKGDYSSVAGFAGRGPSPLDHELTLDVFTKRIRHRRGQMKNVLRNQRFVKGIGNAYADEILLYAGILPFRKRSSLSDEEVERLYHSMRKVLLRVIDVLSDRDLSQLGSERRTFLMIHGKGGGICPLCGGRISEVTANRFKTNYCQTCQK
ncbi:MAG: Fpg/Nei family DNA glycosylase [Promethearchaeota archaeon]